MPDVAHYPNEDCTCEPGSDERCEYRALDAALEARRAGEVMPDIEPGWEWFRELAGEDGAP